MNYYVEKLNEYLENHTPNYGDEDIHNLLEMLYGAYIFSNPIDTEEIREQFQTLDNILNKLSFSDNTAVFLLTCDLCVAHAHSAFLEGVHVGLRLFSEINKLSYG